MADPIGDILFRGSARLTALWDSIKDEPSPEAEPPALERVSRPVRMPAGPVVPARFRGLGPETLLERLDAAGLDPVGKGAALREATRLASLARASRTGGQGGAAPSSPPLQGAMFVGGVGTGKTALASWLYTEMGRHIEGPCLWRQYDEMIEEVQGSYGSSGDTGTIKRLASAALLLIDDLGSPARAQQEEAETLDRQRILWQVVSHRHREMLPTIVTTNLTRRQLTTSFEARTVSRLFELCVVVAMEGADVRAAASGAVSSAAPSAASRASDPQRPHRRAS